MDKRSRLFLALASLVIALIPAGANASPDDCVGVARYSDGNTIVYLTGGCGPYQQCGLFVNSDGVGLVLCDPFN